MSVRRVCMWGYDFFSKNVSYCGLLGSLESGGKKIVGLHLSAADIRNSRGNDCVDSLFDVTAISSLKVELLF